MGDSRIFIILSEFYSFYIFCWGFGKRAPGYWGIGVSGNEAKVRVSIFILYMGKIIRELGDRNQNIIYLFEHLRMVRTVVRCRVAGKKPRKVE